MSALADGRATVDSRPCGQRYGVLCSESVAVLQRLLKTLQGGQLSIAEPFLPASPRFDDIAILAQTGNWFVGAVAEQYERTFGYSSIFSGASPVLGGGSAASHSSVLEWSAGASCWPPVPTNGPKRLNV